MSLKMLLTGLVALMGVASASALSCDGSDCEGTWSKCAGKGFDVVSPCCPGDICVKKHMWYAQCRPESYDIPAGWEGSILECASESMGMYGDTMGVVYGDALGATDGTGYGGELGVGYGL